MRIVDELFSRGNRLAIHFQDHISRSKARIISRARRTNALHCHAVHLRRNVQLLPDVGSQFSNRQAELALLRAR